MSIQLSSSGMNTLDDGSSWGTRNDKAYPKGTWVTYCYSGGTYIGFYRDSYGSGYSSSTVTEPGVIAGNNSYTGIRVG